MNKLLGLDVGEKRIGVAISEGNVVAAWGVILNTNLSEAVREIGKIARKIEIQKVVIGIPKFQDPVQADKIYKFAIELAKNLNLEIDYVDETLTSKEAERMLKGQKIDPKSNKFKEEVDKLAAKYILEQYIKR